MDNQNRKEEITTIPELAEMIRGGFEGNQEYMDKRFNEMEAGFQLIFNTLNLTHMR